jgi:hypothetical protein
MHGAQVRERVVPVVGHAQHVIRAVRAGLAALPADAVVAFHHVGDEPLPGARAHATP